MILKEQFDLNSKKIRPGCFSQWSCDNWVDLFNKFSEADKISENKFRFKWIPLPDFSMEFNPGNNQDHYVFSTSEYSELSLSIEAERKAKDIIQIQIIAESKKITPEPIISLITQLLKTISYTFVSIQEDVVC